VIALFAGGAPLTALRLGLSMLALQASIGSLNDLRDVAVDQGRKVGKPLPRGVVTHVAARRLALAAALVGLFLAAPSGSATLGLALAGLGCGYLYDLRLSRTPWSWLPLALGLPLLPLFAWTGANGEVPSGLLALVPVAVVAGAALALANALVDHDRDVAAGSRTAAVRLGRTRAWRLHALLLGGLVLLLAALFPHGSSLTAPIVKVAGLILLIPGAFLAASDAASSRERGWELEAVAVAVIGASWIEALAGVG